MSDGRPSQLAAEAPPVAEGFDEELARLREFLAAWIARCDREMRPMLEWQFLARSKYFRPVTLFACHRAISRRAIDEPIIQAAAAIEMVHNVSLIIDDILDRSRTRRGILTLHCRFGHLPALMASGFVSASAYELICGDPFCVLVLS
jgi:geranylgeranyl pyrophosphate synthase